MQLAVETLSSTTYGAMKTIYEVSNHTKLGSCIDTAEFCKIADYFLNLTNGPLASGKETTKYSRQNVTSKSLHRQEWPKMVKELQNWVFIKKSTGERLVPRWYYHPV